MGSAFSSVLVFPWPGDVPQTLTGLRKMSTRASQLSSKLCHCDGFFFFFLVGVCSCCMEMEIDASASPFPFFPYFLFFYPLHLSIAPYLFNHDSLSPCESPGCQTTYAGMASRQLERMGGRYQSSHSRQSKISTRRIHAAISSAYWRRQPFHLGCIFDRPRSGVSWE